MKKGLIFFILLWSSCSFAQKEEPFSTHHQVSFLIGHTYVSQGFIDGKREWLTLPSFALDYNFYFSEKWSIGLHNDMIVENFIVEDVDNQEIERSRPFASVATVGFKPGEHFIFQVGLGGEFAKEENFFLTRVGCEYSLELPKDWEFIANFVYDIKWNAYDSFGLSVGVLKSFGR
jgi:hypothetical protein